MNKGFRALIALVVIVALAFGAVTLVRNANGDFSGDYHLTGFFPKVGEGLQPGSEVVFRGVQVGRVSTVALAGYRAKVTLLIEPSFNVPANASATIEPVNLFGAEEVSLTSPNQNADAAPYLSHGGTLAHASTADELGDLFAAAGPLLSQINTNHLATVISELAEASNGEGHRIATAVSEGSQLANFLDATLDAQLQALDSFTKFTQALAPIGPSVNALSNEENIALPAFNQDVANYQKFLNNLTPFANNLAAILTDYYPNIATMLADGDNISRLLIAQQNNIGQVIQGAFQYVMKLGDGAGAGLLPDGSKFAYFNTFILFSDVNTLVCDLIAPSSGGLSFLEPLQQALAGTGSAFNCSSQFAAFDKAQNGAATNAAAATAAAKQAAQQLANQAYGLVGQPSNPAPKTLDGYIEALLGGGL
jgi:phospholipid/cholesterol/gamma-HCH transport system substrate-binding protein